MGNGRVRTLGIKIGESQLSCYPVPDVFMYFFMIKYLWLLSSGRSVLQHEQVLRGGRRGDLMVCALDSRSRGPGSVRVLAGGKTLYSHGASLHPGV